MAQAEYIETSVPSAYLTTRTDPSSLHRRMVTRQWWESQLRLYDVWISQNVVLELSQGDWPGKAEVLGLIEPLRRLEIDEEVRAVAQR